MEAYVDAIGGEQQKTSKQIRTELNVHRKLSPWRRWPWKRYEPGWRKLGISNHGVCN